MSKRLYVGNLSYDTTEDVLTSAFQADGRKVASVTIMLDRDTGRSRGFAFVEMETDDDARAAIEAMDGFELDGRRLRVNEAEGLPASRTGLRRGVGPGRHVARIDETLRGLRNRIDQAVAHRLHRHDAV